VEIKTRAKTGKQACKNQLDSEDLAQYVLTLSRFGTLTVCPYRSSSEPREKQCKIHDRNVDGQTAGLIPTMSLHTKMPSVQKILARMRNCATATLLCRSLSSILYIVHRISSWFKTTQISISK
jgi:hypothetical protein